ncbi:hypothetical protein N0V90_005557 [Kalmusia sp. IMI 367209]|nr:hypothetical protein N0V90_005557 [Kalmusia sp. IMI 367209]
MAASARASPTPHENNDMDIDGRPEGEQQLLDLKKGLSDDDDGFEDLINPGRKEAHTSRKDNKSPRRDDDKGNDDLVGSTPQPKKLRLSLFGGPVLESNGLGDEVPPQTPGTGLGVRLSSLNIDQQEGIDDDGNEPSQPSFNLRAALGLSEDEHSQRRSPSEDYPNQQGRRRIVHDLSPVPDDPVDAYGLRKTINRQGVASTHLDIDQSGNYDPTEEARQKSLKMRQAKQAKKEKEASKKRKGKQKAVSKMIVPKRIVRLRIRAMGSVLNYTNGEENWPEDHSDIDSDEEREREELLSFHRFPSPGARPQIPILDPTGELDLVGNAQDLTGHPVARGCKECRKQKQGCSMMKDGQYPCTECLGDTIDCHPIIEPGMTGRCKRCEDHDQSCSFEHANGDPQAMCDECLEVDNLECEPRPPNEFRSMRIDLDQILYSEDRQWVSCTRCRAGNKKCSLKNKTDKPPCRRCKKTGMGCTFYEVSLQEKADKTRRKKGGDGNDEEVREAAEGPDIGKYKGTKLEEIAPEFSVPGSDFFTPEDLEDLERESSVDEDEEARVRESQEVEFEDTEGHKGTLTTIKTSFAHPMKFSMNSIEPEGCSFCEMPIFAFVGHWEKTVHVIRWDNGLGYTEFAAGHRENFSATVMCQRCVMERVQMIACPGHDFRHKHNLLQNNEEAASQLLATGPGSTEMHRELKRWCSLCFSLAEVKCCTGQPDLMSTDEISIKGCGLKLCRLCYQRLDEIYFGDFDSMVTTYTAEPKAKEDQEDGGDVMIRADVGFLSKEGLLMANVSAAAGFDEDEGFGFN